MGALQYVGPISERLVKDLRDRIELERSRGRHTIGCWIDGQDTARVLRAYGVLLRSAHGTVQRLTDVAMVQLNDGFIVSIAGALLVMSLNIEIG